MSPVRGATPSSEECATENGARWDNESEKGHERAEELGMYVFGDQTCDVSDSLQSLLRIAQDDPVVADWLQRCCRLLQDRIRRLRLSLPAAATGVHAPHAASRHRHVVSYPRFTRLGDLLEPYRQARLAPALSQALVCVVQLGCVLRSFTTAPAHAFLLNTTTATATTGVAGIGIGALAAAAVSCSRSLADILALGLQSVALAFAVGALADEVAQSTILTSTPSVKAATTTTNTADTADPDAGRQPESVSPSPWLAQVVLVDSGIDRLKAELSRWASQRATIATAPYIAVVQDVRHVLLAGPPAHLTEFVASHTTWLQQANTAQEGNTCTTSPTLRHTTAPYHAAHLYADADIEHLLAELSWSDPTLVSATSSVPIFSAALGSSPVPLHATFKDALREALSDCLQRPVALDRLGFRLAQHLQHALRSSNRTSLRNALVAIRPVSCATPELLLSSLRRLLAWDKCDIVCHACSADVPSSFCPNEFSTATTRPPIAIVASAGRFPGGAASVEAMWELLLNGRDAHSMVPASRWNAATHVGDPATKNTSRTGFGCWLEDAASFDNTYFNMSPREARNTDPAQRLALMTAVEAMEAAGIVPDRTPSTQKHRIGVWYGCSSNDWLETNSAQDIDPYFIPGGCRAFIAGRVNYHFKITGPSYTVDTACSSSLAALHMACTALWNGDVDTAIVGGTNVLTNPDITAGLDRGGFLSRTGNCKTFDESADGYCRGEAAVTLVLKRLPDAQADSDPIQACLLGVGTNHNAEAVSITRPHAGTQRELFQSLLSDTNLKPQDITYCEAHGTGTQAGDASETAAIIDALSPLDAKGQSVRAPDETLYLGSVKANLGHGEAVAGVTSLVKVLSMLQHSTIPPHIGIRNSMNPKLPDFEHRNAKIPTTPTKWMRPHSGKRRVLLNNFSAAGGNTSIIVEDPPNVADGGGIDPRRHHIVALSARCLESLALNLRNMIAWLSNSPEAQEPNYLAKLSYTTTARRAHHRHRLTACAPSLEGLKAALREKESTLDSRQKVSPAATTPSGIFFTFTGQGSARDVLMGSDFYTHFGTFRRDVQRYDHICRQMGFPSIIPLFEGANLEDIVSSAVRSQLAHVCMQMALARLWISFGAAPSTVIGHSLGEYAALHVAGVLSVSDAIWLVGTRAQLMQAHLSQGTHTMLAVIASESDISRLVPGIFGMGLEIACRNSKDNIVLGGHKAQTQAAKSALEAKGIRCHLLDTPMAFHTSQVDPILEDFQHASQHVAIHDPQIPVISATKATVMHRAEDIGPSYFVQHCRSHVDMSAAVDAAVAQGVLHDGVTAIEIGPAPVVARLVKDMVGRSMPCFASMQKGVDTWQLLTAALSALYVAGHSINWTAYHQAFPHCQQVVKCPAYGWSSQEYWLDYVHDWTLRKGEPPLQVATSPRHELPTTSIHRVIEDTLDRREGGQIVIDVSLDQPEVAAMIGGHRVYGVPLCTPAVYADLALMIGSYAAQVFDLQGFTTEVVGMQIRSALAVVPSDRPRNLRTSVIFDAKTRSGKCTFSTITPSSGECEEHAGCQIAFIETCEAKRGLEYSVKEASAAWKELRAHPDTDTIGRYNKSMIYKHVSQLADFDLRYRGLRAVVLDNETMEAAGMVSFKDIPQDCNWFLNPGYLDSFTSLGGFVMNGCDDTDLSKMIYVNHGWQSFQLFAEKLHRSAEYISYVRMVQCPNNVWKGDILILDDHFGLVGFVGGIELQGVPARLMQRIVSFAHTKLSGKTSASHVRGSMANMIEPVRPAVFEPSPSRKQDSRLSTTTACTPCSSRGGDDQDDLVSCDSDADLALRILSEESGVDMKNLPDDLALGDIGVDSLLSLVISHRLRDELGVNIPGHELFMDSLTVWDFTKRIAQYRKSACDARVSGRSSNVHSLGRSSTQSPQDSAILMSKCHAPIGSAIAQQFINERVPPAPSVILNSTLHSQRTLFLFPDGCGAATSYVALSSACSDLAIVGFNSPFLRTPEQMSQHTTSEVLASYMSSLRARQPHGPYHLGGWSSGGILAYAAAYELSRQGEAIASLTLIDSPPPNKGLDHLPERFFDHCSAVGLFGTEMAQGCSAPTKPPAWLVPHFRATINMLHGYHAPPMSSVVASRIKVDIIWAGDCAFDGSHYPSLPKDVVHADDTAGMKFLTERRRDFGPGAWADLLRGADIRTIVMDGKHHFSMMRGDGAESLAKILSGRSWGA